MNRLEENSRMHLGTWRCTLPFPGPPPPSAAPPQEAAGSTQLGKARSVSSAGAFPKSPPPSGCTLTWKNGSLVPTTVCSLLEAHPSQLSGTKTQQLLAFFPFFLSHECERVTGFLWNPPLWGVIIGWVDVYDH